MNYYSADDSDPAPSRPRRPARRFWRPRAGFDDHGYDATSLQQIADAMGVTKANVYYYFRTKAAILEALLEPMAGAIGALLDAADGRSTPPRGSIS